MLETLNDWDISLFLFLNNMGCKALDPFFMAATDMAFVPFGTLVLYLFYRKLGLKRTVLALVITAVMILFSDQTCGNYIREMNIRLRPCHMVELAGKFRSVREWETGWCGGQYGFLSSHAGNAFSLAVFASLLLRSRVKHVWWYMIGFAAFISYTRIYIGTHLTGDVIVAGIIGTVYAVIFAFIYRKAEPCPLGKKRIRFRLKSMRPWPVHVC